METPNYFVSTVRGAVPHLTSDVSPRIPIVGVYLEEFFDKDGPIMPLVQKNLPLNCQKLLVSVRKPDPVAVLNKPNTNECMAINTVQGSRLAKISDLVLMAKQFKPDFLVIPYDVPAQSSSKVGGNRLRKMELRSIDWLKQFSELEDTFKISWLPDELKSTEFETLAQKCDGCVGDSKNKLRVSFKRNNDFSEVLAELNAGYGLVNVPLTEYSDKGLALYFDGLQERVIDLNDKVYETDMSKLGNSEYSLAYIHHLLNAEEMTAQVLLQLHNLDQIEQFFKAYRSR